MDDFSRFCCLTPVGPDHGKRGGMDMDVREGPRAVAQREPLAPEPSVPTPRQQEMFALFRQGLGVEEVMARSGLARSTVGERLAAYVRHERPADVGAWVDEGTYYRVASLTTTFPVNCDALRLLRDEVHAYWSSRNMVLTGSRFRE